MTYTELIAKLNSLETRIHELEQDMKHTASTGDLVEVERHVSGDMYEIKNVKIKDITKVHRG